MKATKATTRSVPLKTLTLRIDASALVLQEHGAERAALCSLQVQGVGASAWFPIGPLIRDDATGAVREELITLIGMTAGCIGTASITARIFIGHGITATAGGGSTPL